MYSYEFDVLMVFGQSFKITVRANSESEAYRNLCQLIVADAVSEARIAMTDEPTK